MLEKTEQYLPDSRPPHPRCSSRWGCSLSIAWVLTSPLQASTPSNWLRSSIRMQDRRSVWSTYSQAETCAVLTIFALGIMPYITASIIFQLLTVIYEPLAKLQKEGEMGRRKITQWTRYVTVLLGIVQSTRYCADADPDQRRCFDGNDLQVGVHSAVCAHGLPPELRSSCGWCEQITERGIGNGMSLLIFTGIVVGLPRGIEDLYQKATTNAWGAFTPIAVLILLALMIAVVAFIIFVERSERRIPVQYAKRIVGRKMMGGQSTHPAAEGELGRSHAGHLRGARFFRRHCCSPI